MGGRDSEVTAATTDLGQDGRAVIDHLQGPSGALQVGYQGKVVLLVTCAIHASEIASTQMAMEWAHALATAIKGFVKDE